MKKKRLKHISTTVNLKNDYKIYQIFFKKLNELFFVYKNINC